MYHTTRRLSIGLYYAFQVLIDDCYLSWLMIIFCHMSGKKDKNEAITIDRKLDAILREAFYIYPFVDS